MEFFEPLSLIDRLFVGVIGAMIALPLASTLIAMCGATAHWTEFVMRHAL